MDPSRKRKLRLVVALAAAVAAGGALSTRASAPHRGQQAVARLAARAAPYELTGKVVDGSVERRRRRACASAIRDRDGTESVPVVYTRRRARPVPRGARGDRVGRARERHLRGRARLARHQVPLEVHEGRAERPDDGGRRLRLPRRRPADGALRGGRLDLRRARPGSRELGRLGPPRDLLPRRPAGRGDRRSSSRPSCARTSRTSSWPRARPPTRRPSTRSPRCGRPRTARCSCGRSLLSLFSSAVLFLTRRSLREIAPWATAVLGVVAALLPAADGGLGEPVRHARHPPAEGAGPQPAAAPPGDDDPPADALHGLRRLLDPVRVRHRRADHAPHRAPTGSAPRAASRSSPGPSSAPGSCSARSGPTPSSAGAATGPGTRSRTPR